MKPLAIDLYCGLGGWAEGLLAEGWNVVGFDIERHDYGTGGYPGQLVLQDARTIHGWQFRQADLIVASPPCTEYSYMAMPWSRSKQIARALRGDGDFPEKYTGSRTTAQLNALFDACFRIQREASEAAGHYIPMVVENVKGAQPWIGLATAHFGSFYLFGDVGAVGGRITATRLAFGHYLQPAKGRKNQGGSWFAIGSPGQTNVGQNPDGRKVAVNFHEYAKTGQPGRSFQSVAVEGLKVPSMTGWDGYGKPGYKPQGFNVTAAQRYREDSGRKQMSGLRGLSHPSGKGGRDLGGPNDPRRYSSRSDSRKAASAQIAKIPLPLAQHIARVYKPSNEGQPLLAEVRGAEPDKQEVEA